MAPAELSLAELVAEASQISFREWIKREEVTPKTVIV